MDNGDGAALPARNLTRRLVPRSQKPLAQKP